MYHSGHCGNATTEDLVAMMEEMHIATGIDVPKLLDAGKRAEEILQRRLRSDVLTARQVPHHGVVWSKEDGITERRVA
jgi:hydroxymethylglutaryl-CoA lyase